MYVNGNESEPGNAYEQVKNIGNGVLSKYLGIALIYFRISLWVRLCSDTPSRSNTFSF